MRIGITQRVEKVTSYEEDRDCLDQRWPALLELLEMTATIFLSILVTLSRLNLIRFLKMSYAL